MKRKITLSTLGLAGVLLVAGGALAPTAARAGGLVFEKGPMTLEIDGQLRVRGLTDSKRKALLDGGLFETEYVTQRARLGATLEHESGAALTLQLQDARVWGEEMNTLNDFSANGLDVHQAYAYVPIYEHLDLKLGRQEIVFDNHRLVGNVGWTQRARSFDALRANYHRECFDIDFFYALVSEKDTDGDGSVPSGDAARSGDVTFGGIHSTIKLGEDHTLSLAYYNRANVPMRHYRHTVGAMGKGTIAGLLTYSGELYVQFGSLAGNPVFAMLGAAHLGHTFGVATKPSIELWAEALTGDGTPQGTFDTLFATNHKFYGEMDFFLNIPKHTKNLGLMDLGGRLALSPVKKVKLHVDAHLFRSMTAAPSGASDLGLETDLKVVGKLSEKVALRFLYGVLLPGAALQEIKGVDAASASSFEHFAYLTVDLKL